MAKRVSNKKVKQMICDVINNKCSGFKFRVEWDLDYTSKIGIIYQPNDGFCDYEYCQGVVSITANQLKGIKND
jgi:hypothetical protein